MDLVNMNSKEFVCRTRETIRDLNEKAKLECRPLVEKDNLCLASLTQWSLWIWINRNLLYIEAQQGNLEALFKDCREMTPWVVLHRESCCQNFNYSLSYFQFTIFCVCVTKTWSISQRNTLSPPKNSSVLSSVLPYAAHFPLNFNLATSCVSSLNSIMSFHTQVIRDSLG